MTSNKEPTTAAAQRKKPLDWRVRFGLLVTAAWIFLGSSYITTQIGWAAFSRLPAEELGSFLEGAFAPLAFLWLVIGYFLQQKELEQNTASTTSSSAANWAHRRTSHYSI